MKAAIDGRPTEVRAVTWQRWWPWLRMAGGGAILVLVAWRLGTGPFLGGLRAVDAESLALAAGITVLTTVSSAWRWTLVARGLGVALPLRSAFAGYYRSQFLNTMLPGGVLGDVHRGVSHGREVRDIAVGLRAVWWERVAGQIVLAAVTIAVLSTLHSPIRRTMPVVAAVVLGGVVCLVLLSRLLPGDAPGWWVRSRRVVGTDIRQGLLHRRIWPSLLVASMIGVAGHTATFLVATRAAGVTTSVTTLAPLALLVLLASAVPINVGGWGPREGAAAWVFGLAGLGAGTGVTISVVYGVMALVATLPGAGVLVVGWFRTQALRAESGLVPARPVGTDGTTHG